MGAIPIPLGEKRNSILPSVATGHQSEKREETGQNGKLDATNTPSKLLWLAQANLCPNRRYLQQAKASQRKYQGTNAGLGPKWTRIGADISNRDRYSPP